MKRSSLFLQPLVSQSEDAVRCGHVGGNPRLDVGQDYPVRDGNPYRFLLQIDCAKLPADTWNGLMPRTGWISVFAQAADHFDIRIVYSDVAQIEHQRPDAWDPKQTSLFYSGERYYRYLSPPVAWPLVVLQGADAPRSHNPSGANGGPFRCSNEANWPVDRETHFLLIDEAIRNLDDMAEGYADAAKQREAKLCLPSARVIELLDELRSIADGIVAHWTRLSATKPFSSTEWRARRDDFVRMRVLQTEIAMEKNGNNLQGFIDIGRIERAYNHNSNSRSIGLLSSLFAPADQPGRLHAQILSRAQKLAADLDNDPNVPEQDFKRLSPDRVALADYRSRYPAEWQRYKERILAIRADFVGFWLDNQEAVNKALGRWGHLTLPASWDGAIKEASEFVTWVEEERARSTAVISDEDTAFIQERYDVACRCSNAAGNLRAAVGDANALGSGLAYSASDHQDIFRQIDDCIGAGLLRTSWHVNYDMVRSEVAKRLYSHDPQQLTPPVRAQLERRWSLEADQAVIQLGGKPAGDCDALSMATKPMIMMFQIPSNDLTHFAHGDTGGLVILISESDLRERRFDRAIYDICH